MQRRGGGCLPPITNAYTQLRERIGMRRQIGYTTYMILYDTKRYCELREWKGLTCFAVLFQPGWQALMVYRWGNWWTRFPIPVIKHLFLLVYVLKKWWIEICWGISISRHARIGAGLFINHFSCIFVHGDAVLGKDCTISQGVTIGVKGDTYSGAPRIGDAVVVGAGAKVLGPLTIGDRAIIGANAVVVKDVEAGAIMGGIPAQRIK